MATDDSSSEAFVSLRATSPIESDIAVLTALRPIVFKFPRYSSTESLISDLNEIPFIQQSPSIASSEDNTIKVLSELYSIYDNARRRETAKIPKNDGSILEEYLVTAFEISLSLLHSCLLDIDGSNGDMRVYNSLVPDLQNAPHLTTVIVRKEDMLFWDRCLQLSLQNHPVCGVGNPGIGKTTTTLYLLQHIVMIQKQPVVYTIQVPIGKGVIYEISPVLEGDGDQVADVKVNVYWLHKNDIPTIPTLRKRDAFYVVDPGSFKGNCFSKTMIRARFIMAASNDDTHWGGNDFAKDRAPNIRTPAIPYVAAEIENTRNIERGVFVYGRLWTGPQLLLARPYISLLWDIEEDELLHRFRIVGGSIRDIYSFQATEVEERIEDSLALLDEGSVNNIMSGSFRFAFKPQQLSSYLIGIRPRDRTNLNLHRVFLKSDYIEEKIAEQWIRMAWYALGNESNSSNRGNLFESYVRRTFSSSEVRLASEEIRESLRERPQQGRKQLQNYQSVSTGLAVGSSRKVVRVSNLIASVVNDATQDSFYYSKDESEVLIDMIFRVDNGYHAIKSTILKTHDAEHTKILALKRKLNLRNDQTLRIFYAIPSSRYAEFVTDPVNPLFSDSANVQQALANVIIYHISVSSPDGE
mmetsp:Transcript_21989/g.51810  ORF Transcript_21989/g.51810 Transcript_21989/m.51810 type:complete len:638 (-) Transcript_21989:137-2050(-)|eukprot:CAMPEP_0113447404 /NCGR_PEP_ID=MMETSP0014_2-20120614/4216_1 /TAXON_ID=2857 /ORGANISM="Nitzschia sp." /LENGTH=637 /DNA_ID=CAMNT_0000338549 /DNA_START=53 /DNA_END=1966 /DNA_ORIENTATION=- /assembly_acc=CAM_ASM_000159